MNDTTMNASAEDVVQGLLAQIANQAQEIAMLRVQLGIMSKQKEETDGDAVEPGNVDPGGSVRS